MASNVHALAAAGKPAADPQWRAQELLLMSEVMRLVGKSLAPEVVLREMLHLMSELLGLNRGRVVLADFVGDIALEGLAERKSAGRATQPRAPASAIRYAYGLTHTEMARGRYGAGEGITGRVLATAQPIIVQDIDAESQFLCRAVERAQLPPDIVAFIALPIEVSGPMGREVIGVLACHRIRRRDRQLADDVAILKILATLAGQLLQLQALVLEKTRALQAKNQLLTRALETAAARYGIIGTSPALLQALGELERVSEATASVLLLGESGTGKELFARALHLSSQRRDQPFIKVNCAAIPDSLFESELFGYERGAFTGAQTARAGWFEQADRGTIFLDEIGEMPLAMQTKLLRTLQEGTTLRLGGKREVKVAVRVVAATHRDLAHDVQAGTFRRDLFYRLNVIPIRLPSLRERPQDIRPLALHFLSRFNQANQRNVSLSLEALARLEQHPWPGNIRELGNVIERLVLLSDSAMVPARELERFLPAAEQGANADRPAAAVSAGTQAPAPVVRDYQGAQSHSAAQLQQALALHGGNQSRAAQALGLTVRQFSYRLQKLQLHNVNNV
ncbi:sigma 54-interacting transcriptional regulator [Polaromonas sp.]|jgi:Nif-specific regulatory protein|uniref:sigma 54-interacting transcriptional regulator n=1 Tax=Polaromonas sp. TaxID=1869339 RepID=UPI002CA23F86|nr:sigma 54-interacting transcriptional regulator [Polaromonas sp.]HQS32206.1 sigma 54-interacting transcriptional regulator [Polaromonas sp.]HQS91179.1 sigma 54-interacting transcriptional regulator [Polaromonas sp.]